MRIFTNLLASIALFLNSKTKQIKNFELLINIPRKVDTFIDVESVNEKAG